MSEKPRSSTSTTTIFGRSAALTVKAGAMLPRVNARRVVVNLVIETPCRVRGRGGPAFWIDDFDQAVVRLDFRAIRRIARSLNPWKPMSLDREHTAMVHRAKAPG